MKIFRSYSVQNKQRLQVTWTLSRPGCHIWLFMSGSINTLAALHSMLSFFCFHCDPIPHPNMLMLTRHDSIAHFLNGLCFTCGVILTCTFVPSDMSHCPFQTLLLLETYRLDHVQKGPPKITNNAPPHPKAHTPDHINVHQVPPLQEFTRSLC